MEKRTPINKNIVESRMKMPLVEYLQRCIGLLESMSDKGLLQGLGELMENSLKQFVQNEMRSNWNKLHTTGDLPGSFHLRQCKR